MGGDALPPRPFSPQPGGSGPGPFPGGGVPTRGRPAPKSSPGFPKLRESWGCDILSSGPGAGGAGLRRKARGFESPPGLQRR
jgi:hypothetical protein